MSGTKGRRDGVQGTPFVGVMRQVAQQDPCDGEWAWDRQGAGVPSMPWPVGAHLRHLVSTHTPYEVPGFSPFHRYGGAWEGPLWYPASHLLVSGFF